MKGVRTSPAHPYVFTITARVCRCELEPIAYASGRTLDAVERVANPYWWAFDGFYGECVGGLEFVIVDTRDGVVWWRNGRRIEGAQSGTIEQAEDQPAERRPAVGAARRGWPRPARRGGRPDHG